MIFKVDSYDDSHFTIQIDSPTTVEYNQLVEFARQLPEKRWVNSYRDGRGWRVPLTTETLSHLDSHYIQGKDYELSESAKFQLGYLRLTTKLDEKRAEKRWDYIFDGKDTDYTYPYIGQHPPMAHQRLAVEAMYGNPYFGLLMEMGTGKTRCIIDELEHYARDIEEGQQFRVVIICPKAIRVNWQREFDKFFSGLHSYEIRTLGNQKESVEALQDLTRSTARMKILICSYDVIREQGLLVGMFMPNYIACDESHYMKSSESKRFKGIRSLAHLDCVQYRRILTGTPVSNNLLDLWAQFEILYPGILGYSTINAFKSAFCNVIKIDTGTVEIDKITGYKDVDKLKGALARVSLIVKKERCLDLPEKLYETRRIDMPANLRELYDQFAQNFELQLETGIVAKTDFIIVQMLKLAQICSGYAVANDERGEEIKRVTRLLPNGDAKLKEMLDDATEVVPESKLIIWARFHLDIDLILAGLKERGIKCVGFDGRTNGDERQRYIDAFNNDSSVRVFVCNPSAGGIGLTLLGNQEVDSDRCKVAFYYNNGFSFGARDQSEARNHRIGQRNPVLYRDYAYAGTIEESIASALQSKKDLAEGMKDVSSIRDMLRGAK